MGSILPAYIIKNGCGRVLVLALDWLQEKGNIYE
jgi:hypothetical protein